MILFLLLMGGLSTALALGLALWIAGEQVIRRFRRERQARRACRQQVEDALRRTKSPTYPLPREPRMVSTRRREW